MFSLVELGLGNAITFSLYKPLAIGDKDTVEAYLGLYKTIYRMIGVAIVIVAAAMYPFLPVLINSEVTDEVLLIYVLFTANTAFSYLLFSYRGTLMQANQEKYLVSIADFIYSIVSSVGQIVCFVCFSNYMAGLICMVAAQVVRGLVLLAISRVRYAAFNFKSSKHLKPGLKKELGRNIYAMAVGKFSDTTNKNMTNVIVSSFVGLIQSGLYSNYQMVSSALNTLLSQMFGAITPSVGNFNVLSTKEDKKKLLFEVDFLVQWVYCTCCVCVWCSIDPFIQAWVGEQYLLGWQCVLGIVANIAIIGLLHATVIFKDGCGVFYQGRFRPLATCVLSIALSVILVQPFGIAGAIWAAPLSRALTASWYDPYLVFKYVLNDKPYRYYLRMLDNAVTTVCISIVCWLVCSLLPGSSWQLFVECVAASLLLSQVCLCIRYGSSERFAFLKSLAVRLTKKAANED